ncbi:inverse autotransporter beta domain-containing protein [Campylobacter lari]|nr:inverse autotransporter beta domain-containing protein [Campylobacter lari]MCV3492983.1 inverse autotransporter beta domain-containing protein [Campylobacter lari]MCV3502090.1 inverse autotransporter beta domain-containing protein [Campylobacter lari]MCV3532004.1 inverse autotransporter beta domain-containing protein [Campylobacter lari]
MLGLNLVYDHDFSREHKRISLGFESMLDTMVLTKQLKCCYECNS